MEKKKPSVIMKSENASMILLSPPNVLEDQSFKIDSDTEPKTTPAKIDTMNENLKLLFENWPKGKIMNLDD